MNLSNSVLVVSKPMGGDSTLEPSDISELTEVSLSSGSTKKNKKRKRSDSATSNEQDDEGGDTKLEEILQKTLMILEESREIMVEARNIEILMNLTSRIDAYQNKIDKCEDDLDDIKDTTSPRYLLISRRRKETEDKMNILKKKAEQYE